MKVCPRKLSSALPYILRETRVARANRMRLARSAMIEDRLDAMLDRLDVSIIEVRIWMVGVNVILFCALMAIDFTGH